jgi:hypothetical protein
VTSWSIPARCESKKATSGTAPVGSGNGKVTSGNVSAGDGNEKMTSENVPWAFGDGEIPAGRCLSGFTEEPGLSSFHAISISKPPTRRVSGFWCRGNKRKGICRSDEFSTCNFAAHLSMHSQPKNYFLPFLYSMSLRGFK